MDSGMFPGTCSCVHMTAVRRKLQSFCLEPVLNFCQIKCRASTLQMPASDILRRWLPGVRSRAPETKWEIPVNMKKILIFVFGFVFALGVLRGQTNGWEPGPGHTQVPIW